MSIEEYRGRMTAINTRLDNELRQERLPKEHLHDGHKDYLLCIEAASGMELSEEDQDQLITIGMKMGKIREKEATMLWHDDMTSLIRELVDLKKGNKDKSIAELETNLSELRKREQGLIDSLNATDRGLSAFATTLVSEIKTSNK